MQVIVIDVGRSGVKVVSGDTENYFPSKIGVDSAILQAMERLIDVRLATKF